MKQEKRLANDATKEINFLNIKIDYTAYYQSKQSNQKWAENLKIHLFKEDIQMANGPKKICSASPINKEMQVKTTMRYHLTMIKMTIIKMFTNNKY